MAAEGRDREENIVENSLEERRRVLQEVLLHLFRLRPAGWLCVLGLLCTGLEVGAKRLTIYHTNDLHGRMLPGAYFAQGDLGGLPRLVGLLEPAAQKGALIIDGGDALGADPLSHFDAGRLMVSMLGRAGYAALVVGNHEFDFGLDSLQVRAKEASFAFLGANVYVGADSTILERYRIEERMGLKIGLVGLVSPSITQVLNPIKNKGLDIGAPAEVLAAVLEQVGDGVDYFVVLAHMPQDEIYALARSFPQVDLFIGGGGKWPQVYGGVHHLVRLSNKVHIATVPQGGFFVGRIEVEFESGPSGWQAQRLAADLVPLDDSIAADPLVSAGVAAQSQALGRVGRQRLGQAAEPIGDTGVLVADLMRTRVQAEVGLINAGALRPVGFDAEITRADVDSLIRYDDVLVELELNGAKLSAMAASSAKRLQGGQQLIFSGFDPAGAKVDGRPLDKEEVYRVVTTAFLASGGDGYLKPADRQGYDKTYWLPLSELVIQHIRSFPLLQRQSGLRPEGTGAWKNRTKINGTLARTGINKDAGRYRGVSFLSGQDAMAWNGRLDSRTHREGVGGAWAILLRSSFGQLHRGGQFHEAVDRLEGEVVHTWRKWREPFVSLNGNSVWTRPKGEDRPLTVRASSGLSRKFGKNGKLRLGLGLERDFARRTNDLGLELVPQYRRKFNRGNALSSSAKIFFGATQKRKISLQNYNALLVNIVGNLYATVDVDFFLHRDNQINAFAVKSELEVGLGYTWNKKWF